MGATTKRTLTASGWREWCMNEGVRSRKGSWVHLLDASKLVKRAYLYVQTSSSNSYADPQHDDLLAQITTKLEKQHPSQEIQIEQVRLICDGIINRAFVLGLYDKSPDLSTFCNWCRRVRASTKIGTIISTGQAAQILKMGMLYCLSAQRQVEHPSHRQLEKKIQEDLENLWQVHQWKALG